MSRTRFNLLFYLKKRGNYEGGLIPVYMRVTAGGKRTEFATQREWDPAKWNAAAGRANGTKEEARELNAFLDSLKTKVYEAQRKLLDEGGLAVEKQCDLVITECDYAGVNRHRVSRKSSNVADTFRFAGHRPFSSRRLQNRSFKIRCS